MIYTFLQHTELCSYFQIISPDKQFETDFVHHFRF